MDSTGQQKFFFFGASTIRPVLGYIWVANSKNDVGFFASALVFEIRYIAYDSVRASLVVLIKRRRNVFPN